jgi:hypothetical protein
MVNSKSFAHPDGNIEMNPELRLISYTGQDRGVRQLADRPND